MNQSYECPTHGRMLTTALNADGKPVKLPDALKAKRKDYFCPDSNCGRQVVPEGSTIIRATDSRRRGHFNVVPDSVERYAGPRRESAISFTIDALARNLMHSEDFNEVYTQIRYRSEINRDNGWWAYKSFDIDLAARRSHPESLDVVLHVVEFPTSDSANDLYRKLKEIAIAPETGRKRRYLVNADGEKIGLSDRIYQNIIIVQNEHSYRDAGTRRVQLTPTIHNFIRYFTGDIYYFDPESLTLKALTVSDPHLPDGAHPKSLVRVFKLKEKRFDCFTFSGEDLGRLVKPLRNRDEGNSINILDWKLAVPVEIMVDDEGQPLYVMRPSGQIELIL